MIKTHSASRFELKTLEGIRDSADVILQAHDTGSNFEGGKRAYLCEVVRSYDYNKTQTTDKLAEELIKTNEENRRLRNQIERLKKQLERERVKD